MRVKLNSAKNYTGQQPEEKLEQTMEETENKPGSELPWEKASVTLATKKLLRKVLAAKEEV
jgi:hypothetical protein